ncbi:MAG: hypothetical protein JJU40_12685 [Rhodobacteraceae bacterium]|nr:hypothetical protein [Paracoccaceae bacterium]
MTGLICAVMLRAQSRGAITLPGDIRNACGFATPAERVGRALLPGALPSIAIDRSVRTRAGTGMKERNIPSFYPRRDAGSLRVLRKVAGALIAEHP